MNKERQGASRRSIGGEIYVKLDWHDEQVLHAESEIKRLQSENKTLWLAKDDFKKRLNDSGYRNKKLSLKLGSLKKDIRKAQAEAIKEFAERVKLETTVGNRLCVREYDIGYNDGYSEAYYSFHKIIDGLLKEYEK